MRQITARRAGHCPQCKGKISAGDDIGQPEVKNRAGGMMFAGMWYCAPCAIDLEELGPGLPYIDYATRDADQKRLEPVHARLKQRRADNGLFGGYHKSDSSNHWT